MHEGADQPLFKTEIFEALAADQIAWLHEKSKQIRFRKGDLIFCQGDIANAFYVVIDGWVSVIRESKNAEKTVLHVWKAGDSFAEPAALVLGTYPANAYAATNCELLEIRAEVFKQMLASDSDGDIAMQIIKLLSHRLSNMTNELEQHRILSVTQRLALFLLGLTQRDSGQTSVELPFSKMELANYLGIPPESLSRALGHLKKQGVTSTGRTRILIEDINQLSDFAKSE